MRVKARGIENMDKNVDSLELQCISILHDSLFVYKDKHFSKIEMHTSSSN